MYVLRDRCGFGIQGHQWDVLVEHGSSELDEAGHAKGADVMELWAWLSGQLGQELLDVGNGQRLSTVYAPGEQPPDMLARQLVERPEWWTAERMASCLLLEFRKLSSAVQAVSVTTALHMAEQRTCTVRTNETRPVTQAELVDSYRGLARLNPGFKIHPTQ